MKWNNGKNNRIYSYRHELGLNTNSAQIREAGVGRPAPGAPTNKPHSQFHSSASQCSAYGRGIKQPRRQTRGSDQSRLGSSFSSNEPAKGGSIKPDIMRVEHSHPSRPWGRVAGQTALSAPGHGRYAGRGAQVPRQLLGPVKRKHVCITQQDRTSTAHLLIVNDHELCAGCVARVLSRGQLGSRDPRHRGLIEGNQDGLNRTGTHALSSYQ